MKCGRPGCEKTLRACLKIDDGTRNRGSVTCGAMLPVCSNSVMSGRMNRPRP